MSTKQRANALRILAMDAVQHANSGHPGMPLGMADIAEVLWHRFLRHNPKNPQWINRDRFIVSNGHGAMLHYALLHLSGYNLSIDDLKQFRQWHSKTPGHPEYGETPGVETSTGPLGQGLANAVGMAIAEAKLAQSFNQSEHTIIDHFTYAFCGDGCLMEGISHEVCSLAGTLQLGKLIVFWDDNGISIDGDVRSWFSENTAQRFKAYHWQVIEAVDGHDSEAIAQAIQSAQANTSQPTLICCKTTIAKGAPDVEGSHKSHGAPLGNEAISSSRQHLGWQHEPFVLPKEVYESWQSDRKDEQDWQELWQSYQSHHPDLAKELERRLSQNLPSHFLSQQEQLLLSWQNEGQSVATRKASMQWLEATIDTLPELLGGSADLSCSNLTQVAQHELLQGPDFRGNYLGYGVREFGMAAIMNGLALYGGFIPYGGTFLVFQDYARNAIRLSALMRQKVIYVFTHDSIGLGEDGPTHQPIEQLSSLRAMPHIDVWRPCDRVETAVAWSEALKSAGPSALILSRQTLAHQTRSQEQLQAIQKGAYILYEPETSIKFIIIATGSEIDLAVAVAKQQGHTRVVSMPCVERFKQQDKTYQNAVIPPSHKDIIAIEAGSRQVWYEWVGRDGLVIGIDSFGASAPGDIMFEHYGFSVDAITKTIQQHFSSNPQTQEVIS